MPTATKTLVAHGLRNTREGIVGILTRAGHDVLEASDVASALALVRHNELAAL